MNISKLLVAASVLTAALTGCDKETDGMVNANIDSLEMAERSLLVAWDTMMKEDDLKLHYIKRIMTEVGYTNNPDNRAIEQCLQKLSTVKENRYKPETMTDQEIDRYDSLTDDLIFHVMDLVANTQNVEESQLILDLKEDIMALDRNVIRMRSGCDVHAREYNQHLRTLKAIEGKKTKKYSSTPEKPVFAIVKV